MKNHIGKWVLWPLLCLLILSLLAGCAIQKQTGSVPSSDNKKDEAKVDEAQKDVETEPLSLPIVKEPLTLTYYTSINGKAVNVIKNYNDIAAFKEMEKVTGIHIDFQHPSAGQEGEQINLMLASQELPDIIFTGWSGRPGGPAKAIDDGAIIKLNEYIDKYAPNFKKILNNNPSIRKQAMLDNGTFYMFPFARGDESCLVWYGPQIRKDWLDNVGMQPPKTLDDWYNVLKAFKTRDPNGNGQADELPFVSNKLSGIRNFAGAYGLGREYFYKDGDQIKFGPIQPAYKEYLSTMKKWYDEGLIDPDFASTDGKSFDSKVTGNVAGSYFGSLAGNMGRYINLMKDKDPKFELIGVSWPIGPAGKAYMTEPEHIRWVPGSGAAISTKNKYIKESVKWEDFHYSEQGQMLMNFGVEGESYKMENGYPKFTDVVMKNPDGLPPDQAAAKYMLTISAADTLQDPREVEQLTASLPQQKDALKTWLAGSTDLLVPLISPTAEESQKLASIMGDITTYTDEMFTKFIMGQEPLQNFDQYVNTIKAMGIDEALKIQQAALERYNARK